ncbi:MAG: cytidylate kinase-like family protein [Deltaproteobacteria bacterium]|nr:cytidylate kinase-like family protein [Deltaproteobacteria bacterium]
MSVITIARKFGAGGETLGKKVAKKLDYTLVDSEIIEQIAIEANVSPEWVDSVAKETGSEGFLSRLLSKLGPFRKGYLEIAMENNPGYIDGNLYISLLHKVLPKIALQDNVVIIGRGGQYILADHPNTYHFLMIADMEHRIRFMMDQYKFNRKQAQLVVEKQSKRRQYLYRYFSRTDYDQPELYNMVFNMNKLQLDEAVQAVCQLVGGQS